MSIGDNYQLWLSIPHWIRCSRSQVLDFQILRLSTCWSTPESGFLDDMKQNLIQTWTRWGSPHGPASLPWFFDVFLCPSPVKNPWRAEPLWRDCQVATKGRIHSCGGLRTGSNTVWSYLVWTSCAAQLRFCCCLTEGQQQHSFAQCLACSVLAPTMQLEQKGAVGFIELAYMNGW